MRKTGFVIFTLFVSLMAAYGTANFTMGLGMHASLAVIPTLGIFIGTILAIDRKIA